MNRPIDYFDVPSAESVRVKLQKELSKVTVKMKDVMYISRIVSIYHMRGWATYPKNQPMYNGKYICYGLHGWRSICGLTDDHYPGRDEERRLQQAWIELVEPDAVIIRDFILEYYRTHK